jgi:3D (Asp-Asp-Asp) domain-containing protein
VKIIFSGSAILATALLISFLIFARPMAAETLLSKFQHKPANAPEPETKEAAPREDLAANPTIAPGVTPELPYVATAYSLRGLTASGKLVQRGIVAADPRLLPLGSRIRIQAGNYSGEYLVADTGGAVRGRKIDIWIPSTREAMRFGRRKVKLTVLSFGPKRLKRTRTKK